MYNYLYVVRNKLVGYGARIIVPIPSLSIVILPHIISLSHLKIPSLASQGLLTSPTKV